MQAHSKQKPEQIRTRKPPELLGARLTSLRYRYDRYNRNASKRSKTSSKSFLTLHSVLAILVFLTLTPIGAVAQSTNANWVKPYTEPGTLGKYLEDQYSDILKGCGINALFLGKKNRTQPDEKNPLSSIPQVMQMRLASEMGRKMWLQERESIARLLVYVYPSNDLKSFQFDDKWLLYDKDFLGDPSALIPPETSVIINTHSCTGILSAAVNAGASIPFVNIETAVKAEYGGRETLLLALAHGRFYSPFAKLLYSTVSTPERLSALLTLWNWYSKQREISKEDHYIITSFNGIALMEVRDQRTDRDASLQISGSLRAPFFSASAKGSAAIDTKGQVFVKKFATIATIGNDNQPDVRTEKIPKPTDISDAVSKYGSKLEPNYNTALVEGGKPVHKQRIEGIPESLCSNSELWEAVPRDSNNKIVVRSATSRPTNNPNVASCEFEIVFDPPSEVFRSSQRIELNYAIQYKIQIGAAKLMFEAQPVSYSVGRALQLGRIDHDPRYSSEPPSGGKTDLTWRGVDVSVEDYQRIVDWTKRVGYGEIKIVCSGKREQIVTPTVTLNEPAGKAKIELKGSVYDQQDLDVGGDALKPEVCNLTGILRFSRSDQAGTIIDVALPSELPIHFPKVRPTPTLALQDYKKTYKVTDSPDGKKELSWEIEIPVTDEGKLIDWSKPAIADKVEMICSPSRSITVIPKAILNQSKNTVQIGMIYTADPSSNLDIGENVPPNTCEVTATLKFTRIGPNVAPISIAVPKLNVFFPPTKGTTPK